MAIDYGDYANRQGQSVDLSPLQQGIQRFLDKSDQIATIAAQNFADNQWSNMMSPYQNALTDDVTAWNPTSFVGLSPGIALENYKSMARSKGNKVYEKLASAGEFNPVNFKQKYDQLKASYMPSIEQKLASYKAVNNLSDKDMKLFVERNPQLQKFLLDNADPAGIARDWAMPYVPEGFIGGGISEFTNNLGRYGLSLGGAQAGMGAIREGFKQKSFGGLHLLL